MTETPPTPDYRVVLKPGPAPSPIDLAAAREARQVMGSQLADIRAAAGNWRTGLIAMLGLVTTILAVKGRDTFKDLDLVAQVVIGITLLVALALASWGSVEAMKAAYGDPQKREVDRRILVWDYQDAVAALDSLAKARRLFFAALAAIVIAIGLTWYWPAASSQKVRADNNGTKICGTLKRADATTVVISEDGSDKSFPTSALRSLTVGSSCP